MRMRAATAGGKGTRDMVGAHRLLTALAVLLAAETGMVVAGAGIAATPEVDFYGKLADGRSVERFTLRNGQGMVVRILSLGGIISEISVPDRNGRIGNVVLTRPDLAAYAAGANFSSLLGRYANRISNGGFTLDGQRYDLAGASASGVVSHGGPDGFSEQIWQGTVFGGASGPTGVVLRHVSPDGDNGFPGTLEVTARFTLDDDNTLRLEYGAITDKPTVLNLSHHVYFNLAGPDSGAADDQCVQILADRYAETKAKLVTGRLFAVAGTPFDLRQPTRIGSRLNVDYPALPAGTDTPGRGYDTPLLFADAPPAAPAVVARAWDPASGRTMELATNQTSVQFYTPGLRRPAAAGGGAAAGPFHTGGYALETQHLQDSPNHAAFPSTVLRPGERFTSETSWHFTTYDPATGICPAR